MLVDIDKLRERVGRIDAERESLAALIEAAEAHERAIEALWAERRRDFSVPYRGIKGWRTAEAAFVADEFIERRGRPVHTEEVAAELQARGLYNPDASSTNAIDFRLAHVPHLQRRRGRGWWPAHLPWPGERASTAAEGTP